MSHDSCGFGMTLTREWRGGVTTRRNSPFQGHGVSRETGKNLAQCHFVYEQDKTYLINSGIGPKITCELFLLFLPPFFCWYEKVGRGFFKSLAFIMKSALCSSYEGHTKKICLKSEPQNQSEHCWTWLFNKQGLPGSSSEELRWKWLPDWKISTVWHYRRHIKLKQK